MIFRISLADRIRAAAGIPAHIRRKRRIEDLEEALLERLIDLPEGEEIDLGPINDLIDRHNRYYPIEANLPIDLQTGEPMLGGQPWKPLEPLTLEALSKRAQGRLHPEQLAFSDETSLRQGLAPSRGLEGAKTRS